MGKLSNELKIALLNLAFGGVTYTPVVTLHVRLCTTAPTASSNGTEVSTSVWTNYVPAAVTNNTTNFPTATGIGAKTNGANVGYGVAATTGTVDLAGFEVWSAATGGTRLGWGTLTSAVINGIDVFFGIGDLDINVD